MNYWVVETDYTNYSVVYNCIQLNPDNTCKSAMAWVYSRRSNLPDDLRARVSHVIESLCLNEALFHKTTHKNGDTFFFTYLLFLRVSGCIVIRIKHNE